MLMLVLGSMMVACVGIVDIIETNVLCCRVDVGVNGVGGVMDVGGVGIVSYVGGNVAGGCGIVVYGCGCMCVEVALICVFIMAVLSMMRVL